MGLVALAVLGGCSSQNRLVPIGGAGMNWDGPIAVDVQNALGEVDVTVDPDVTAPEIEAIPLDARPPIHRVDRTNPYRPWVAAEASINEGGRVVRVLCKEPEGQAARPVYLRVRVPSCEGVRVRNTGGSVHLRDVSGAIDVENGPGPAGWWPEGAVIDVQTDRPLRAAVTLVNTDAVLRLALPYTSTGTIDARSPDTTVNLATARGNSRVGPLRQTVNGQWSGTLNGGDNTISLRSGTAVRMTTVEPGPDKPVRARVPAEVAEPAREGAEGQ